MGAKGKRGEILIENVVFIILNILFFSILVLFLLKQGTGAYLMEQSYSKQIALLVDSSLPGTIITLNMNKAFDVANKNNFDVNKIISFSDNYVTVKLSEKGGYSYHYFTKYNLHAYVLDKNEGTYVIGVSK